MIIKDIYQDIKDLIKLRVEERKIKQTTLDLLKEFQGLEGLRKWFDYVAYGVTPTGVFYETKLEKLMITVNPKKKTVDIVGQMDDGSYMDQVLRVKEKDIRDIAEHIAESSLPGLKEELRYLQEQMDRVIDTINSTEERLKNKEFSAEAETTVEKKAKKEAKKKMKKLVSKSKKK